MRFFGGNAKAYALRHFFSTTLTFSFLFSAFCTAAFSQPANDWYSNLTIEEKENLDRTVEQIGIYFEQRNQYLNEGVSSNESWRLQFQPSPEDLDDLFQDDPINKPIPYDGGFSFPFPSGGSRTQGSAYLVALETLYQTLNFFGVTALIKRTEGSLEFRILESKSGYFRNLTKIEVMFALREFARYLNAHLCNDASMDNFYKALIVQVPMEEVGLRFKYDFAWTLLGNPLPREPNTSFVLGRRWSALGKLLGGSQIIREQADNKSDIKTLLDSLTDVVNLVQGLNKLMCFVDIRPKAKDELRKRSIVKKFLDLVREMEDRASALEEEFGLAEKAGVDEMIESLRTPD